jgi:hypothetical protein
MMIHGGTLSDHDYAASSKAQYTSAVCTNASTGAPSKGTNATYHLVEEQGHPALFERGKTGSGTLITNRWTAPDGDQYFTWVHHGGARPGDGAITALFRSPYETGWQYLVPPSGPGARLVYDDCKMSTGADGVTKPTSAVALKCDLTPTSGAPGN